MELKRVAVILVVLTLALVAWLDRYQLVVSRTAGDSGVPVAYRLDRWTGEITYVQQVTGIPVKYFENKSAVGQENPQNRRSDPLDGLVENQKK